MADVVSANRSRFNAYLICGTPRTGSTLLCDSPRSTEIAGRQESYFRPPDEQAWADRLRLPRNRAEPSTTLTMYERPWWPAAAVAVSSAPGTLEEIVAKVSTVHPDLAGADLELLTRAFGRTASYICAETTPWRKQPRGPGGTGLPCSILSLTPCATKT